MLRHSNLNVSRFIPSNFISVHFDELIIPLKHDCYTFQGLCLHETYAIKAIWIESGESGSIIQADIGISSPGIGRKHPDVSGSDKCRFEFVLPVEKFHKNHEYSIYAQINDDIKVCIGRAAIKLNEGFEGVSDIALVRFNDTWSKFIVHNENDSIQRHLIETKKFYEIDVLLSLRELTPQDAYIYDVGSNIGNHAVFFSKHFRSHSVFCFEPNPLAIQLLESNVILNKFDNIDLSLLGFCITNDADSKMIKIKNPQNNLGGVSYMNSTHGDTCSLTLDLAISNKRCDLIKIDVEGLEYNVLQGAITTLTDKKPVICIEVTDRTQKKCLDFLQKLGYSVHKFFNHYHNIWTIILIHEESAPTM